MIQETFFTQLLRVNNKFKYCTRCRTTRFIYYSDHEDERDLLDVRHPRLGILEKTTQMLPELDCTVFC